MTERQHGLRVVRENPAAAVPFSPDELSAQWLTRILRERGVLASAEVSHFKTEAVGAGSGFLGQLFRIHLSYDRAEPGAPSTLVGKFASPLPAVRQLAQRTGMYLQEVSFYQELGDGVGIGVPACYFAGIHEAGELFVLLLEDLKDGVFGDQLAGCTPDQARLALEELARFHARWWNHPKLKQFPWLRESTPEVRDRLQAMYDVRWPTFREHADSLLTPCARVHCPELARNLRPLLERAASRNQFTLGHGDFRVDNVFFPASASPAKPLVVLDWQRVNRAWSGTTDIANFLAMGLQPEDLAAHRTELLVSYYAEFARNGIENFSVSDLFEGYRVSLLQTLLFVVVVSGVMKVEGGNDRSTNLAVVIFTRLLGAIEEASAWELVS